MRNRLPTPWIVLVASLILTAAAVLALLDSARELDEERFLNAVQSTQDRIAARLDTYIALLRGGTGLFATGQPVSAAEFHEWTERIDTQRRFPGIQGIGFTLSIPSGREDSVVSAMRSQGVPGFHLWPDSAGVDRHAILYLEPSDARNKAAFGYNMFSEPARRAAMAQARDTGRSSMSGAVTLVQEISGRKQTGFLIYIPVYRKGRPIATEAERREALLGFIYAPFRSDDLFEGIFGSESRPRIAFSIYDGEPDAPGNLLHTTARSGISASENPAFTAENKLTIAGRTLTIRFANTSNFSESSRLSFVPFLIAAGLLMSLLLFALTRSQVHAHEVVRDSERRLRAVLESLPVGVFVAEPSGQVTFVNTTGNRIWGSPDPSSALSLSAFKGSHPETGAPMLPPEWALARALKGERTGTEVVDIETFNGVRRTVLTKAFPMRTKSGRVESAVAAMVDITEQRAAEAALRERERELQTLVDAIPQLAWMADADGAVLWYNQRWYDFTATSAEEMKQAGWTNRVHPDHADRVTGSYDAAIRRGTLWEETFPLRGENGRYQWFLSRAVPLRDAKGAVLRWFGTNTDVTEQMQAQEAEARAIREQAAREAAEMREEQLLVQAAELERSNRELQEFAYVASHDLQEPLRKISAFSDLIQVEYGDRLDDEGVHYLERMQHAALRMSRLIRDLLSFSRVTTKANPFEKVDLNAALREVLTDLELRITETDARIHASELPVLEADPMQMRQILQNLIANGLKFHRDGVPPVVRITSETAEDQNPFGPGKRQVCRISVADNGIGFDPKYLDRIFLPFQRLQPRGQFEGTGIGLAICRRIAERHGGTLTATSTPGEGATFSFTLPLVQPKVNPPRPADKEMSAV